ncbi:hypothetical protein [Streptomyces violaceusniger]|uniref:Uncharacterized protein n=1 Tax=Streptomyces violaceusniger (strain Tu 4113) TaxID=653045 RepID=G2PHL8_STRV4|nr:hypothetical protein [Streptomyces violaceusniger]AEM89021.1 hypothetical protein Strvi_0248 [Streptomyces violaceusniger Tu 4113]
MSNTARTPTYEVRAKVVRSDVDLDISGRVDNHFAPLLLALLGEEFVNQSEITLTLTPIQEDPDGQ